MLTPQSECNKVERESSDDENRRQHLRRASAEPWAVGAPRATCRVMSWRPLPPLPNQPQTWRGRRTALMLYPQRLLRLHCLFLRIPGVFSACFPIPVCHCLRLDVFCPSYFVPYATLTKLLAQCLLRRRLFPRAGARISGWIRRPITRPLHHHPGDGLEYCISDPLRV